ncbi:MAG TPA: L-threonylcarbamoyladenylate synthase, partial [Coriobacteriia bacterium]|nr:L-threonylcarbamoyladenylate synthase [Coriobacteriia bacterium]
MLTGQSDERPCPVPQAVIEHAARIVRAGGVVAFPTETVYGLGADATDETAVARVFALKGRPADHPLIVHLPSAEALDLWARDVPPTAHLLASRFWPGPLTLILKRGPVVSDAVTGGQDTVGLRIPGHPVALALLREFGGGIAAPSANRFGRISPTRASHVIDEFGAEVDYVVDGGPCAVGVESTILDLTSERPRVLRPGGVTAADIAELIGEAVEAPSTGGPRTPGRLASHYAPRTPLRLARSQDLEALLAEETASRPPVATLARRPPRGDVPSPHAWVMMPSDA